MSFDGTTGDRCARHCPSSERCCDCATIAWRTPLSIAPPMPASWSTSSRRSCRRADRSADRAAAAGWSSVCRRSITLAALLIVVRHLVEGVPIRTPPSSLSAGTPLVATGSPADWSESAKTIAEIQGHVYCFSLVGDRTARVVWGTPKRAEDIDTISGARRPSRLEAETFENGCPQLSLNGKRLLFSGRTHGGAAEIRLSEFPDGHSPSVVASGDDPVWLSDDSFVYNVDAGHVGVFSLPTMGVTLLAEPAFGNQRVIVDKSVNHAGNAIALLVMGDASEYGVVILEGRDFEKHSTFPIQPAVGLQFGDGGSSELFLSSQASKAVSTLAVLDWPHKRLENVGRYPGFDIIRCHIARGPQAGDNRLFVLARRASSDAWLYDGSRRRQLTTTGDNYSAAQSSRGHLLLSKWIYNGDITIWWQDPRGTLRQLTHGPRDAEPSFARDARRWAYADYARKSIMICAGLSDGCRVLRQDESLPTWPRFSPDGELLAYVTEVGASKLVIVSTKDGALKASWGRALQVSPRLVRRDHRLEPRDRFGTLFLERARCDLGHQDWKPVRVVGATGHRGRNSMLVAADSARFPVL